MHCRNVCNVFKPCNHLNNRAAVQLATSAPLQHPGAAWGSSAHGWYPYVPAQGCAGLLQLLELLQDRVSYLLMLGIEDNQLPRLSLGILCLQVMLQPLVGPVALGEEALEAGDEAAQLLLLLLEVATFILQGCFSSFSHRTMAWSFALLAVRLDTFCFSSSSFRMSPMTSPFSWALHSSSLASWSSSREIFPWRISITSSKHSFF